MSKDERSGATSLAEWVHLVKAHTPAPARRAYRRLPASVRKQISLRSEPSWRARDRQDRANLRMLIQLTLAPGDSCIDVGANCGSVLAEMVHAAPDGRHVAIEPVRELADLLRARFPSVDVHCLAASDRSGVAPFEVVDGLEALSSLAVGRGLDAFGSPSRRLIEVEVRRLDDIVDPDVMTRLLKIDVEGAEIAVLRGARTTIERSRPTVVVEHNPTEPEPSSHLWHLLTDDYGYRVFDMDGNGPLSHDELVELAVSGTMWNWVAHD